MTNEQITTAKQIINDFRDLFSEKPITVLLSGKEVLIRKNGPILHPHYKELENRNILFGIGTEYTEYGMPVIGINSWKIIKPNGDILDKVAYSDLELELTQQSVEIGPYSSGGNLIRF
jgi:hypothetical protein